MILNRKCDPRVVKSWTPWPLVRTLQSGTSKSRLQLSPSSSLHRVSARNALGSGQLIPAPFSAGLSRMKIGAMGYCNIPRTFVSSTSLPPYLRSFNAPTPSKLTTVGSLGFSATSLTSRAQSTTFQRRMRSYSLASPTKCVTSWNCWQARSGRFTRRTYVKARASQQVRFATLYQSLQHVLPLLIVSNFAGENSGLCTLSPLEPCTFS
ncbi:hypothetical protein EDD21DRAFT_192777 [Dissophora ornata]|nr:hypothetical protein EDD21DRAFT_192777 [Dissophora ornata]